MKGIYKITNKETGRCYIGQSKNLEKRTKAHFQNYIRTLHGDLFQSDLDKYGRDGFKVEILEECEEKDLLDRERYYIALLKPEYNVMYDGHEVSAETRKKIRKKLTGLKQSEETRKKRIDSILARHKVIPQTNAWHRKKVMIDDGKVYESVLACSKDLGVNASTVTKAIRMGHKVKGKVVRYVV